VAHPIARLSVFRRQLLVKRVLVDGWPTATVAEQLGISRATAYNWVRRYAPRAWPVSRTAAADRTARLADYLPRWRPRSCRPGSAVGTGRSGSRP
jgi:transposase